MRRSLVNYGSHLPVLIRVMSITSGDALEMGMGYSSTPVMHWMCATTKRRLVSYENDQKHFDLWRQYEQDFHQVIFTGDWDTADIERPWDVAFIDHHPGERRKEDARRVAQYAKYVILHDSDGRDDRKFHYSEIYPLFRWRYSYDLYRPQTIVLSNFVDLTGFTI